MADTKISALTALGATPASTDLIEVVDVSDTAMAATGTNKKVTYAELTANLLTATSQITTSANGAASTPAIYGTGTVFTGGSAATTFPAWYHNVTGASAVNSFSVNGTFIGCNMPSGFSGNFMSLHVNGASANFIVTGGGAVTCASTLTAGGTITTTGNVTSSGSYTAGSTNSFIWTSRARITSPADAQVLLQNNAASTIGLLMCGRLVSAKTGNYTVLYTDSNAFFTNTGASGTVVFTLPTASAGLRYTFYIDAAQTLQINAGASTTIRSGASVTSAAGNVSANTQGNVITLQAISTTQWVAESITGTWTFA